MSNKVVFEPGNIVVVVNDLIGDHTGHWFGLKGGVVSVSEYGVRVKPIGMPHWPGRSDALHFTFKPNDVSHLQSWPARTIDFIISALQRLKRWLA